jgi:hypothetical protein
MPEMILTDYAAVKSQIRTGDCIVWNGKGSNFWERMFSLGIHLFAGPVTHISTPVWFGGPVTHISTPVWFGRGAARRLQLWESTAQGQMIDSFDRRIARAAEEGWLQAWWLPMASYRRSLLNEIAMSNYMVLKCGTPYDVPQAMAFDFRRWRKSKPSDEKLFCSESHLFALLNGGAIRNCNPSEAHPQDVVTFDIHDSQCYYQIFGEKMKLRDVGTVEVDGWNV